MPNIYISPELLIQSYYGILGLELTDDSDEIKRGYTSAIISAGSNSEAIAKIERARAVLSDSHQRGMYNDSLYRCSLEGQDLLTPAELDEFNRVAAIIINTVAPHKAGLLFRSAGSGKYTIGDLPLSESEIVPDAMRVLTATEGENFWHLLRVFAASHGGKMTHLMPLSTSMRSDELHCNCKYYTLTAKEIRGALNSLKREGAPIPMEEIAAHYGKVDEVTRCFNTLENVHQQGYDISYGLLNMFNSRIDCEEERVGGFLLPRFDFNRRKEGTHATTLLNSWLGADVNLETRYFEMPGFAEIVVNVLRKDQFDRLYANKSSEIRAVNLAQEKRRAKQQVVSRFYAAIRNCNLEVIRAEVLEAPRLGVELVSLNIKKEVSPVLYALRCGVSNEAVNVIMGATHFEMNQENCCRMVEAVISRTPLCCLFGEGVRLFIENHRAEYEAERQILKQSLALVGYSLPYINRLSLFVDRSVITGLIKDLATEDLDPLNKDPLQALCNLLSIAADDSVVLAPAAAQAPAPAAVSGSMKSGAAKNILDKRREEMNAEESGPARRTRLSKSSESGPASRRRLSEPSAFSEYFSQVSMDSLPAPLPAPLSAPLPSHIIAPIPMAPHPSLPSLSIDELEQANAAPAPGGAPQPNGTNRALWRSARGGPKR